VPYKIVNLQWSALQEEKDDLLKALQAQARESRMQIQILKQALNRILKHALNRAPDHNERCEIEVWFEMLEHIVTQAEGKIEI
jgi:hypothetical protein